MFLDSLVELATVGTGDPGASPLPPFVNISQARTEAVLDALLEGASGRDGAGHQHGDPERPGPSAAPTRLDWFP